MADKDTSVRSGTSEESVSDRNAISSKKAEELRLKAEIKLKEEKVRKLRLVKMYRSKVGHGMQRYSKRCIEKHQSNNVLRDASLQYNSQMYYKRCILPIQ